MGGAKAKEEIMNMIITNQELQRLSKAELCNLLDKAYQELVAASPGSPAYHAALASYESIYKALNQKLSASWANAAKVFNNRPPRPF